MIIRQRYKDYESNNIIKHKQGDIVQREGVLSFKQEKELLKIASQNFKNNVETMENNEQLEIEEKNKESIDLIDEMKILDKAIKYGKNKYKKEKEKTKEIIKKANEIKQEEKKEE